MFASMSKTRAFSAAVWVYNFEFWRQNRQLTSGTGNVFAGSQEGLVDNRWHK